MQKIMIKLFFYWISRRQINIFWGMCDTEQNPDWSWEGEGGKGVFQRCSFSKGVHFPKVLIFQRCLFSRLLISGSFPAGAMLSNKRKTANPTLSPAQAGLSRVKMNEKNKREESAFHTLLLKIMKWELSLWEHRVLLSLSRILTHGGRFANSEGPW